ncbi:MAG: nucleotidyltransferase family protein [Blastocatellia bacterium]
MNDRQQTPDDAGTTTGNTLRGRQIADMLAYVLAPSDARPAALPAPPPITTLLLHAGAGALAWHCIRDNGVNATPAAGQLHQAYRLHTLQAALKELEISQVFAYLRSHGLEPLLGKGWGIARQYPELGLRPYGDIDLYVRPDQYHAVEAALRGPGALGWNVDLHRGGAQLDDRDFAVLQAHAQRLPCNGVAVNVFGPEDHLRLLCLHMLKEGVLRPLWLCDIAVALRALPPDFDWTYFCSGDARRTDWAICAIGLAHHILGAEVAGLPIADRAKNIPSWMVPVVLREWGTGKSTKGRRTPMSVRLRRPMDTLHALRERWPNAIEATVGVHGPFNEWPRLPFQLGDCLRRMGEFAWQAPRLWRGEQIIMK